MKGILFPFVALFAFAINGAAQITYVVSMDTAALIGHPAAPFSLSFQLADGSETGDGNNAAVLSNFSFGAGGYSTGTPQVLGGASGTLESTVVLTDSGPANWFAQTFTAGETLSFTLTLTTNVDMGGVPDGFVFSILDSTGTPIPTLQGPPLDVFLAIYLGSANPSVQTFESNSTQAPAGGGSPINLTPQVNVQFPPPPSSYAVYATGTGCGALSFLGNTYTDSFNSSLGSYSQTKEPADGNVGASGNVFLGGSALINGAISTPNPTIGKCSQNGPVATTGITLWGNAEATGGYAQLAITPSFPSPVAAAAGAQDYNFTSDAALPPGNYHAITVRGRHTLTLSPGTYDIDSIDVGAQSVLTVSPPGKVIVNVAGTNAFVPVNFEPGSVIDASEPPANFQLIYGGGKPTLVWWGATCNAELYAPNSPVVLGAGSQWYGAMVVQILLAWDGSAIHFDASPLP